MTFDIQISYPIIINSGNSNKIKMFANLNKIEKEHFKGKKIATCIFGLTQYKIICEHLEIQEQKSQLQGQETKRTKI